MPRLLPACAILYALGALLPYTAPAADTVKLTAGPLTLPTYLLGEAERNPIFYQGRKYQGAKGPVYPYPMLDRLTDTRQDKTYQAVFLENRYVRFSILPELGGRILTGTDKTNQYEFFYRQHVIRPALVGMAGAWISGGVEWNIPHHHRASTFMPVDYRLVENRDGSKTVWLGELERRHRMKWLVGLTLFPDKSYLEVTTKLFNRTPTAHSMLCFANVAVHANADYQVIFPPSTRFGTQHAKREFTHWPIGGNSIYADVNYNGIDVSWWKNHPKPVSIFAFDCDEDFVGGYDHGRRAGVVHLADHHVSPGKKFFEWGNGPEGRMWDKVLTETDGPYLELMTGVYSDNQPDYSWIEPYEVRTAKEYWYPIRELGGIQAANLQAAVSLSVDKSRHARLAVNTTTQAADVCVVLRAGQRALLEEKVAQLGPEQPWTKTLALPEGVPADDLTLALLDAKGRELIRYQTPKPRTPGELPMPVEPPLPPAQVKTTEELYLIGLRLEQFHNPALEPDPYYAEALRRDPDDVRTNTALGILYCKRGRFQQAEQHLQKALMRLTRNYTRPKNGEPHYYLGVAQRAQGKSRAAEEAFQRAAWSYAWSAASLYQLAELASGRKSYAEAMTLVDRALAANAMNTKALNLKAVLLRKLGRPEQAAALARRVLTLDPLDFWAANELCQSLHALARQADADRELALLNGRMRSETQSYLELATDYGAGAFYDEAIQVLTRLVDASSDRSRVFPMVHYYLGFYYRVKGDQAQSRQHYQLARQMPPDYCFPFRLESVDVLRQAMAADPHDARAPYYLGNLLFDIQPEQALVAWERSRELDAGFATVHRNLGLAYSMVEHDPAKAVGSLEKAIACDPHDAKPFAELDQLQRLVGADPQKRLAFLEKNHATAAQRMDSQLREILLNVLVGRYDRAIALLEASHFRRWEGDVGAHDAHIEAHLLRGLDRLHAGRPADALADFQAAAQYPLNLEVGRPYVIAERDAKLLYCTGLAHEALGDQQKARQCFQQATAKCKAEYPESWYYQGLAHRKLGDEARARERFEALARNGRTGLTAPEPVDFFAKFGVRRPTTVQQAEFHYQIGLGALGLGRKDAARREFTETLRLDVDHLGARTQWKALDK
jgi:tetratricopeptide (TPR) repeat protein